MFRFLIIFGILFLGAISSYTYAQTDTEFWFAAPRVTPGHGADGGTPINVRLAAGNIDANVSISIPANPDFVHDDVFIPANTAVTVDLSAHRGVLENEPIDTVLNKGLLIQSTNLITAYYEIGTHFNPDIFSLKGQNALGTDFYVPFQNYYRNGDYNPQPYSAILIVATQDNTSVTITPSADAYPNRPAGEPFTITLNRGQTYSVAPDNITSGGFPRPGQLPENRLIGTHIESDFPIAVTTTDDSVWGHESGYGCRDLIGDQIVPVEVLGHEYIAMRGELHADMDESFYVVSTEENTIVFIDGIPRDTINAGESYRHVFTEQTHFIRTLNTAHNPAPAYVYHVAGFGCEMGGALLPPINICTGSTEVSFTRSKGESFFLNILVRAGAEYGFILNGDTEIIDSDIFNEVPGTTEWLAGEIELSDVDDIPIGEASLLQNTIDVFHLGIINGGPSSGTMYGYFSDFNMLDIESVIANVGTDIELFCHGYPIQLVATGGTQYSWDPPDFLNDPTIPNPIALPDTTINYTVTVSGACDITDQATVTLVITDPVKALFSTDKISGCSPLKVTVFNHSIGVTNYSWRFGDGEIANISMDEFEYTYTNDTDETEEYKLMLVGRNPYFCVDTMFTNITVHPEVQAKAGIDTPEIVGDTLVGCAPLAVNFDNLSTGAENYMWRFGDGGATTQETPAHTFHNYSDQDTTYTVILEAKSEHGCIDYDTLYVNVKPFVRGSFSIDSSEFCSPVYIGINNNSVGASSYLWSFDDGEEPLDTSAVFFEYYYNNPGENPTYHNIQLYVENEFGCYDEVSKEITIFPNIEAGFDTGQELESCGPHLVEFENLSDGAHSYIWTFGDGQGSSFKENPEYTFKNDDGENSKEFEVKLISKSEFGCKDSASTNITVFPKALSKFTFEYAEYCAPVEIEFENISVGGNTFTWNFGDGSETTTSDAVVHHIYNNPGETPAVFNVSLYVENEYGCNSQKTRPITINPEIMAAFNAPVYGCHPFTVSLENLSAGAHAYKWSFGDGATSNIENPSRIFKNNSHLHTDTITIMLVAKSNFGCADTTSTEVYVHPKPLADFSPDISQGCAPLDIVFMEQTIGATEFLWNFGDGPDIVSNEGNQHHTYQNNETDSISFIPELIVINEFGCSDTLTKNIVVFPKITANYELSENSGCHPLEVEINNLSIGASAANPYQWSYGDGTSSAETSGSHTHIFKNNSHLSTVEFELSLVAKSEFGCESVKDTIITVYPKPKSLFNSPDYPMCSPARVFFNNLSVGGSGYLWDFGDGEQATAHDVQHFYNQPYDEGIGTFMATLTVENQYNCTDTFERPVIVYPEVIAEFSGTLEGCHPHTVNFENRSLGAIIYEWELGDDHFSNLVNPENTFLNNSYTDTKSYNINLTAISEHGCVSEKSDEVTVYPRPNSDFLINQTQGCSPLSVEFSNLSIGGNTFLWDFGNGTSDNAEANFSRTYINTGELPDTFNIKLTTRNIYNCSSFSGQSVIVFPEVTADFTSEDDIDAGCTPLTVSFLNQSQLANQYIWTFGDGSSSTTENPTHMFVSPGHQETYYDVELEAISQYGCTDYEEKVITVYPKPIADFFVFPYEQFFPSTSVVLSNLSSEGNWLFHWDMGDGNIFSTDSRDDFEYTYEWEEGEYQTRFYDITLKAENPYCYDSETKQVMIKAPHPIVGFTPSAQGCPPFKVQFNNQSMYGLNYFWDFGDGNTSTESSPEHTFTDPGSFHVKLVVEGEGGLDSAFQTITVFHPPIADFRVEPEEVQLPYETVKMINLSSLGATYEWDFGDGNMSFEFEPEHLYQQAGSYDISLTVGTNTYPQCFDTMVKQSAVIADEPCNIFFPNAFVPDSGGPSGGYYAEGDPSNKVFHPIQEGIEKYEMKIYSRWGELLFRTDDLRIGWDGYYKGRLVPNGVYVYRVWATCSSGKKINKVGDVTVYR